MGIPGKTAGSMRALLPSLVFLAAMTLSLVAWYRAWRGEEARVRDLFLRESETVRKALTDAIEERETRLIVTRRMAHEGGALPTAEAWRRLGGGFEAVSFTANDSPTATADPVWLAAAEQARDQGHAILSRATKTGVALVLPDYGGADPGEPEQRRAALRGWFAMMVDLPATITAIQTILPAPLAIAVLDQGTPLVAMPSHPVRQTGPRIGEGIDLTANPSFSAERPVTLGGRLVQLRCIGDAGFDDATRTGDQIVVLVLGVGLTLALWITVMVLQNNQRRFQDIAESASDWFWETNAKFEFTYMSDRFFEITGLSPQAVLGRTQWDVAGPRQIASARSVWQAHFRMMAGREPFRGLEMILRDRNGATRHILLSGKPSFYDNGIFRGYRGIGSDITERKAAEAEAAKKSAQLRAAIEAMPNGLIMFGEDLKLILYNRRYLELWGITEEELESRRYLPHMIRFFAEAGRYGPGDISQLVAERLARIVQPTVQGYELRLGDGRILETRSYGRSEAGYLLTYLDITNRRDAEDALRQSEGRLKLALAATKAGVWDIDLVANSRWWTPELGSMLGYPEGELEPSNARFRTLVHPEDWRAVRRNSQRHLDGITSEFRAQYRLRRGDGDWTWVEDRGQAIRDANGRAVRFIGTVVDISERRATQAELMRSEKMAALGRLVAGVAHEINTPVGLGVSVASHLDQCTRKLLKNYQNGDVTQEDFEDFLEVAQESSASLLANLRRAASLVSSFKLVAVDQSSERQRSFNLRAYIDEILTSLRPRLKKYRHTITVNCSDTLVLSSDPGAISQILTNLVENSLVHAFDGGIEGQITIDACEEGAVLVVIYADNGRGMAVDHLEKIFEPFFTTRMGQGGSGLGMHVVYNLVRETLGGHIRCTSAPGHGMTVTIRLPVRPPSTTNGAQPRFPATERASGVAA